MSMIYSRLLMILVVAWLTFPVMGGAVAWAQQEAALNGVYNFTMNRHCATGAGFIDITLQGTVTYDGLGTASFSGQSLVPINSASVPDANQATQSCSVTYTVATDGIVSQNFSCNLTFTSGPLNGQNATLNGIQLGGQLSLDGTVLVLSDTDPNVETFTSGAATSRVCNGSGIATSRR